LRQPVERRPLCARSCSNWRRLQAAALGLLVTGIVGSHTPVTPHNERYLAAKSEVETRGALQLGLATLFEASRGGATTPTAAQPGALPAAMPHHVAFDSA
jgi:hypothetical protein